MAGSPTDPDPRPLSAVNIQLLTDAGTPTQVLVMLLRDGLRMSWSDIARATGASTRTPPKWYAGGTVQDHAHREALGYLCEVVAVLASSMTPAGVRQWLWAQNTQLRERIPLLRIHTLDPRILDAARFIVGEATP